MKTTQLIHDQYDQIVKKRTLLENVRKRLKTEFVGINHAIDQVVDLASSWFLFPSMQDRPVIINLWGMTGVGKTSLVKKFIQFIDFQKKYFHFEMNSDYDSIRYEDIEEITSQSEDKNVIITLDEFQYLSKKRTQPDGIWEFLDTGILHCNRYPNEYFRIQNLTRKLHDALNEGVLVVDGLTIAGNRIYNKIVDSDYDYSEKDEGYSYYFFPQRNYEDLREIAPDLFRYESDVYDFLLQLDGKETIDFLKKLLREKGKPREIDCSKALVFVLGNLDDAYKMTKDFNPDLSADEFHDLSSKINIADIKNALLMNGFRSEQIARLGNNHIIYPSFSSESYQKIIGLELVKIHQRFFGLSAVGLSFDETIKELIYKEGVYPTQGTRPVYSTIYQIISSKLGDLIKEIVLNKIKPTEIVVKYHEDMVTFLFMAKKRVLHLIEKPQHLNLEPLRKNRCDDMQAITAVHESGHAVLSMVLLSTIPEAVFSITADAKSGGFIQSKMKWDYMPKHQIIRQVAMTLGGYVAERIVFGEENVTAGSATDLEQATNFVLQMLKSCGLGNSHYYYYQSANYCIVDHDQKVNEEAKKLLDQALTLAELTLQKQMNLLLHLADYLADHASMKSQAVMDMLVKYCIDFDTSLINDNADGMFYRTALKNKIRLGQSKTQPLKESNRRFSSITLNTDRRTGVSE